MKRRMKFLVSGVFVLISILTLACQVGGIGDLFATQTPTPTNTSTPTITPSPTSTATSTPEPTFTPTPVPTGLSVQDQPDGAITLIDYDNAYQMTIPTGWVIIPLSGDDFSKILNKLAKDDPDFSDAAKAFEQLDPNLIRVVGINKDKKYISSGFATNITVAVFDDAMMSALPMNLLLTGMEESMKSNKSREISSEVKSNKNGVEVGILDYVMTSPTAKGGKVDVHSRLFLFQVNKKLVMIQLATPKQLGDDALITMDAIFDTIEMLKP